MAKVMNSTKKSSTTPATKVHQAGGKTLSKKVRSVHKVIKNMDNQVTRNTKHI